MHGKWLHRVLTITAVASVAATTIAAPALSAGAGPILGIPGAAEAKNVAPASAPLVYDLKQLDGGKLRLTARNASKVPMTLVFLGPTHEVVIRSENGGEAWRLSKETAFTAAIRVLRLKAGATLSYDIQLPDLPAGKYTVEASLLAVNAGRLGDGIRQTMELGTRQQRQLEYTLATTIGQDGEDVLGITVRNQSRQSVEIPARDGVLAQVTLQNRRGSKVSDQSVPMPAGSRSIKVPAGEERVWFVAAPGLSGGESYTALVTFPGLDKGPAIRQEFVAGKAAQGLSYTLTRSARDARNVQLQVTNNTSRAVTLSFPTSQRFDMVLWDAAGNPAWRWSDGQMFAQRAGQVRLNPGAGLTFDAVLPKDLDLTRHTLAAYLTAQDIGSPVLTAPAQAAVAQIGFGLDVVQKATQTQLVLKAENKTREPVTLKFPTAQQYDFVLKDRSGKTVWRWSDGQMFAQQAQELRLNPGAALRYEIDLPARLAAGTYTAEAWFLAGGHADAAVATEPVTIGAVATPIQFQFRVDEQQAETRLALDVTNPSREAVTLRFPSAQQHDFVLKDHSGKIVWRWSDGQMFAQRAQELRLNPGARLRYEAALPAGLPAGTYRAEAWFLASGHAETPVATGKVTVADKAGMEDLAYRAEPVYERGRLASFRVLVTNTARSGIDLEFPTDQHMDMKLKDGKGKVAWTWSYGEVFDVAQNMYRLGAGETREYLLAAADAPRGSYTLELFFPAEADRPVLVQSISIR